MSRERAQHHAVATERARAAIAQLGVFPDRPDQLAQVVGRVDLLLWKFLKLRGYEVHRFFTSVEPTEAMELVKERYAGGKVLHFFSERQDDAEFENAMTVGLSLVFAAIRQAEKRGFNPKTAGVFTLQRMMEQAVEPVDGLEELLQVGAPP